MNMYTKTKAVMKKYAFNKLKDYLSKNKDNM